ncbi:uncharacterized protein L201_003238 [Kwoniella dendrophila CBS 6074]|uniref:Haloacid dehalogenase, type II n=1 Tax=Kwoniella dendrophila CBS 6074 TaxID=1295534 RepID=A0AAX4JU50_9TREE
MTRSICFDALGTCFTLKDIISAVEGKYGDELAKKGFGSKGFVLDWFHSAQRDYTYLSLISPPPPPIASILKTTFPLTLSSALSVVIPSDSKKIEGITSLLNSLPAAPTLKETFEFLSSTSKLAIITNGSKSTTEKYASIAGIDKYVEKVISCDDVGLSKPHKEVYQTANQLCEEFEYQDQDQDQQSIDKNHNNNNHERWFVAAHLWDLVAAKKAGFKTGLVLSDLPDELVDQDEKDENLKKWYEVYGGRPDIVGKTLLEVAKAIVKN